MITIAWYDILLIVMEVLIAVKAISLMRGKNDPFGMRAFGGFLLLVVDIVIVLIWGGIFWW